MSNMRNYTEDNLGVGSSNEKSMANMFGRMQKAMARFDMDPFRSVKDIAKSPEYMDIITESAFIPEENIGPNVNKYAVEDRNRLNTLLENVGKSILNEAVQGTDNLSPIILNSFGIQERALISTHLPRAVKQVTAKVDNFKLTERMPYIVDLAGNKSKFIDAFVHDSDLLGNLKETKTLTAEPGALDLDLYTEMSISKERKFGYDSYVESFVIEDPTDDQVVIPAEKISFDKNTIRQIDVETGNFNVAIWYEGLDNEKRKAVISGQFVFTDGKLAFLNCGDKRVKEVKFAMVLSPETHHTALTVGYDTKHTPVHIPIGEHFEYSLSEEFKDAADKYYNIDAMALLTDLNIVPLYSDI